MLTNKVQAQALSLPKTISGDPKKKSSQYQQVLPIPLCAFPKAEHIVGPQYICGHGLERQRNTSGLPHTPLILVLCRSETSTGSVSRLGLYDTGLSTG